MLALVYTEGLLSGLKVDAGEQVKRILRTEANSFSHPFPAATEQPKAVS